MNTALTHSDDLETADTTSSWVLRSIPFGIFLIIASIIGFLASFSLSAEKYEKLANPEVVLSCDLNPFFSCGSVMEHAEAELLGFPNQLMGVAAFVIPLLLGVLILSGTRLPRWVMVGLNIGLGCGVALVMFLFYVSIYKIGVGCPWCIIVWTVTIPMFMSVTARNLLTGAFGRGAADHAVLRVLAKENIALSVLWMLIIFACIVVQFWAFFSNLL